VRLFDFLNLGSKKLPSAEKKSTISFFSPQKLHILRSFFISFISRFCSGPAFILAGEAVKDGCLTIS
jgi:hypothetical protein